MGTVADKLNKVLSTKADIKSAIIEKGVEVLDSDTFASYGDKIRSIKGDSGGDTVEGYPLPLDELPDLEQIMADNQSEYTNYRVMYLMRDDRDTIKFINKFYDIYTSDGKNYKGYDDEAYHTWNKSKDIVLKDGSRWRWFLFCISDSSYNSSTGFSDASGFGNVEYIIYSESFKKIQQATCAKRIKFLSSDAVTITEQSGTYSIKGCFEMEGNYNSAIIKNTSMTKFGNYVISGKDANGTFSAMKRLQKTPELPAGITSMSQTFSGCYELKDITIDTSKMNTFYQTFNECKKLKDISNVKFDGAVSAMAVFSGCSSIEESPEFNFNKCTSLMNFFMNCTSLRYVKNIGGSLNTSLSNVFSGCWNLEEVDTIDFTKVTDLSGMFNNCINLKNINNIIGTIKGSIDLSYCSSMKKETFIKIFNALDKSVSSKKITLGNKKYIFTSEELDLIPTTWTVA